MAANNLYTGGGEFTLPNGKPYVGNYHIHPDKGAMVGAIHRSSSHPILTPVNETVERKVNRLKSTPESIPTFPRRSSSRPSSRSVRNRVSRLRSGY